MLSSDSRRKGALVPMRPQIDVQIDSDMVWVPGGEYLMGSDAHYPEEAPAHHVWVNGFVMDRFPVTNARFRRFVEETHYVTFAELPPIVSEETALLDLRFPGSLVFEPPVVPLDLRLPMWWRFVRGADWRHPLGRSSSLDGLDDHPVVHVTSGDAIAFATWEGKTLPTEAEWELAARGGLDGAEFAWGHELSPGGRAMANIWQGEFPWDNRRQDGYVGTSPVDAFPANGYGLHDMIGNVWEWTADWYRPYHLPDARGPRRIPRNPRVDRLVSSYDARYITSQIPRKVVKGGSHLCAANYCRRYRPAARQAEPIDTSACHIGFRCIVRPTPTRLER
jgi:formylglycine-generating enzyme